MKKTESMMVIHPQAAGIDVGSRSHFVAIGQDEDQVEEFSVYQSGLNSIVSYLNEHKVKTVAMESTGSYWQSLFMLLQESGFDVLLVQGTQTKNLKAKTDVKDAQWIQKLHSLGLLRGSFLPCDATLEVRTLYRHRSSLVEESSKFTNKMQKSLRLMNFRLDIAVSDITGATGLRIIHAIIKGEYKGERLAQLCDARLKKSKEEVADALQGKYDFSLMYELKDCYETFMFLRKKIKDIDSQIDKMLHEQTRDVCISDDEKRQMVKKQRKGKNQPQISVQEYCYKLFSVDLMAIESISSSTLGCFLAEIGTDIYKFETANQFVSWLRLAPNNKISGGKVLSSKTPKGKNRFALALRNAANTIEKTKTGFLVTFFKRIAYKKGRAAAITATARKLALIIWNMIIKKTPYKPMNCQEYANSIKTIKIRQIEKTIRKYKIDISSLSVS